MATVGDVAGAQAPSLVDMVLAAERASGEDRANH